MATAVATAVAVETEISTKQINRYLLRLLYGWWRFGRCIWTTRNLRWHGHPITKPEWWFDPEINPDDFPLFPTPNPHQVIDSESEHIHWNPQPTLPVTVCDHIKIDGRIMAEPIWHWCEFPVRGFVKLPVVIPSELEGKVDPKSYYNFNRRLAKLKLKRSSILRKPAQVVEEKKRWKSGRMSWKEKSRMLGSVPVQTAIFNTAWQAIKVLYHKGVKHSEHVLMADFVKVEVIGHLSRIYLSDGRDKKGRKSRQWDSGKPVKVLINGNKETFSGKTAGLIRLAREYTRQRAKATMGKEWEQYRELAFLPTEAAPESESENKTIGWMQRRKAPPNGCIEWNEDGSKRRWAVLPNGRTFPLVSDSFVPAIPAELPECLCWLPKSNVYMSTNRFDDPSFGELELFCPDHKTMQDARRFGLLGDYKLACGCVREDALQIPV